MKIIAKCSLEEAKKYNGKLIIPTEEGKKPINVGLNLEVTEAELEEAKALKAISSIRVLNLEECSPIVRQNFQKTLQTFHPSGYTPIIFSKEADETNYIYVKEKKGYIRELLILSADKQDGAIVHIKGRIKPEEVNTVVKQNTKKKLKEL